jgi:hypothetical protein
MIGGPRELRAAGVARPEIEKILLHCGLWEEPAARGPPAGQALRTKT